MRPATLCITLLASRTATGAGGQTQAREPGRIDSISGKQRLIVLSDIGNEPDDQMSLVRLLL